MGIPSHGKLYFTGAVRLETGLLALWHLVRVQATLPSSYHFLSQMIGHIFVDVQGTVFTTLIILFFLQITKLKRDLSEVSVNIC